MQAEFATGIFLKAIDKEGVIVGSVRARSRDGTLHIGKLMVRPDCQGQGIGTALLQEIERAYPHARYELFTSARSVRNIALYERAGYVEDRRRDRGDGLLLVYLSKTATASPSEP